ncbi:hypothetical protein FRC07_002974 [Ceratobasidium sp. 392]|nr:hypothetical protein FRC07_002974 [Ceratobasidium sp. 392]
MSSSKPSVAIKRHSEFYMDDSLVVIQIEETLFKVHRYLLEQSEAYNDIFGGPSEDPEWGTIPQKPYMLEDITASDFECLLKVLYARQFTTRQLTPETSLITSAFRLAHKWKFKDLIAYLLPLLEKELNDVDKVAFSREFNIKESLVTAHTNLCLRTEPFTTDEAVKLGVHSLLLIYRLRDEYLQPVPTPNNNICCACAGYTLFGNEGKYGCGKCNSQSYFLKPTGSRASGTPIRSKVEEWIENGCVFEA